MQIIEKNPRWAWSAAIAKNMGIDLGQISCALRRLRERGFVQYVGGDAPGGPQLLKLTDAGRKAVVELVNFINEE